MGVERWWIDDWELTQSPIRNIEFRNGLSATPAVNAVNAVVPNRTGEVWTRKQHAPGVFILNLWLGDDDINSVDYYWDQLLRAAGHVHRRPWFRRQMPNGEMRQAPGEVISSIQPTFLGINGIRAQLEVRVPDAYWVSENSYTVTSPAGSTLPKVLALDPLEPSTAPMEHLLYRVWGPITNPQVIDITDGDEGDWWKWIGSVPSGAVLTVHSRDWEIYGDGFTPEERWLSCNGPRLLTVPAARPGQVPRIRLRGSGGGGTTKLQVYGPRSYLG